GYTYFNDSTINPTSDNPQRDALDSVVLEKQFHASLKKLNPDLPEPALHEAFQHVLHLGTNDIMTNNEKFHQMLCDGVTVEHFQDGQSLGLQVKLIDFENYQNNDFWAVNQFVIKENNQSKRLDVILFVNGLPLVVIELKSAVSEKATLERAFTQIQNYKTAIPSIFNYNALCIISDGIDARTSTLSAPYSRFLAWKSPKKEENGILPELHIMAEQMLKPEVLLKLIRFNTVFESEEIKDEKTGILSLVKIKKVAAYHQYYLVEKAVLSTLRAICRGNPLWLPDAIHEDPTSYGVKSVQSQPIGDRKIGVVWHTQGSGKSLSMVFYAGRLVVEPAMRNPTIVILTDRNDLDDQLFATFGNCTSLLRQTPVQANNREHLKELLTVSGGGIVFTTIQKFYPEDGKDSYDALSDRANIVVVADEAHRSQYGFTGKVDDEGNIKYGNAKHLRDALPHASFIGFTGTPIEKEDRDTLQVFGEYIDVYDIAQAVKDGATVPLSY
ncbi:MAG: type I restriction endonuclease, partial [Ghiorsea sp.]|nr:type I restriction endonuclease [Ghiorsea sp.]